TVCSKLVASKDVCQAIGLSLEAGGLALSRRRMQSKSLAEIEGQTESKNLGERESPRRSSRAKGLVTIISQMVCHAGTCPPVVEV
ncbi:hypothetical protein Golob_001207, partial [Gossypium lobatum]|nr:hypothetical protein [Gossypium lobatum]